MAVPPMNDPVNLLQLLGLPVDEIPRDVVDFVELDKGVVRVAWEWSVVRDADGRPSLDLNQPGTPLLRGPGGSCTITLTRDE